LPFADLDIPGAPDLAAAKPVAPAPAAPTAADQASTAPDPDVVAALQVTFKDAAPKASRSDQGRAAADQAIARSAASTGATDLRAEQPGATAAPAPVAEIADAAPRPVRRAIEAFALPTTPAAGDAAASPTNAAPALGAPAPHVATATTTAPTADASALAGHGAAIDTRADDWHAALASRVQVLVDQHVGEAHIKLNPPELGAVDIKISLVDDKTFVQLTAGTSAARDELTQSLPKLRELLSASGLSFGGASVQGGSAGQNGHEAAPRFAAPAYAALEFSKDIELEPVRPVARGTGRIDLFA
jgi:flagellar hook-length control protein FliK